MSSFYLKIIFNNSHFIYILDPQTHSLLKQDYTCIEIQNIQSNQQPWWMLIYEETQEKLKFILEKQNDLKKLQEKRILIQFDDCEVLDKQIYNLTQSCTQKILDCEKNCQKLQTQPLENQKQNKILKNIQKQLAVQIQESAKNLRNQQKSMFDQLKKQNSGYTANFLQLSAQKMLEMQDTEHQAALQDQQLMDFSLNERDKEISSLLENISQLGEIFKTMGQLVVEQGTILDRIDFNIQDSLVQTKQATVQLQKADTSDKNSFGQKCIKIQIGFIILLLILLVIKYVN